MKCPLITQGFDTLAPYGVSSVVHEECPVLVPAAGTRLLYGPTLSATGVVARKGATSTPHSVELHPISGQPGAARYPRTLAGDRIDVRGSGWCWVFPRQDVPVALRSWVLAVTELSVEPYALEFTSEIKAVADSDVFRLDNLTLDHEVVLADEVFSYLGMDRIYGSLWRWPR